MPDSVRSGHVSNGEVVLPIGGRDARMTTPTARAGKRTVFSIKLDGSSCLIHVQLSSWEEERRGSGEVVLIGGGRLRVAQYTHARVELYQPYGTQGGVEEIGTITLT